MPRTKAAKGTVVIQVFRERLRLVWSHQGQRYFLYVGLPDTSFNRMIAEGKAKTIEIDMAAGSFDKSLRKYKGELSTGDRTTAGQLFERFMSWKEKRVYARTMEKYSGLKKQLDEFFQGRQAVSLEEHDCEKFIEWLSDRLEPVTLRERLGLCSACWDWAQKTGLVEKNPWSDLKVRVPVKRRAKPFTKEEVERILNAFKAHPKYKHYVDYVTFLFGTGCRTGEAIGLRWESVSDDCSQCWIGEAFSRGVRKEPKRNEARTITLTPSLSNMLLRRKPEACDSKALVFPAPQGCEIDDHNFRNRAWKKMLEAAKVSYRKPYTTRKTFGSHALAAGMNPVLVAEMMGHDVKTLFKDYAGSIDSRPRIPELFSWHGDHEEEAD